MAGQREAHQTAQKPFKTRFVVGDDGRCLNGHFCAATLNWRSSTSLDTDMGWRGQDSATWKPRPQGKYCLCATATPGTASASS